MQKRTGSQGSVVPRSRYLAAAAALILALGILQAIHVFMLPVASWFSSLSGSIFSGQSLKDFFTRYGYLSLFALMALESASLPVPSEVVLPLAGYFVLQGAMNFWSAVLVSTVAALAGALFDYYLAVWLGRPFVIGLLKAFRVHRGALDRAEGWFQKSGQWTVFAARFVPGLRTIISLPAGLFEMRLVPFVVMTLAGCLAWNTVLIYAGVLAGNTQSGWLDAFKSSTVIDALSAFAAAVSAGYLVYFASPWFLRRSEGTTSPT